MTDDKKAILFQAIADMNSYIKHDAEAPCNGCDRWEELQAAIMYFCASAEEENARLREAAIRKDCEWVYEEDTDMYETGCGQAFCFIDGDPEENLFRFCYHCGGNLVLAALEPNHE